FLRIASSSPSTPVPPRLVASLSRESSRRTLGRNFPIDCPATRNRERNARHLVGKRYRDELEGLLLDQLLRPHPQRVGVRLAVKEHAQPPGKRPSATSLTSLRIMASPKVLKSSICTTNAPGPPITFSR